MDFTSSETRLKVTPSFHLEMAETFCDGFLPVKRLPSPRTRIVFLRARIGQDFCRDPGLPEDAIHPCNFIYATGETNGVYVLYGSGAPRS